MIIALLFFYISITLIIGIIILVSLFVGCELYWILSGEKAYSDDVIRRGCYAIKCLQIEKNIANANHSAMRELYWWYDNGILSTHEMYVLINELEIEHWFDE